MKKSFLSLSAVALFFCHSSLMAQTKLFDDGTNAFYVHGWGDIRLVNTQSETEVVDGTSRINFNFTRQMKHDWEAFFALEAGANLVGKTSIVFAGGDTFQTRRDSLFNLRIGKVGARHDKYGEFTFGKNWGVYYDLASNTDYGHSWAGTSSGVYNYNGDGGLSGTGRADKAIQYRNQWGGFSLAVQGQFRTASDDVDPLEMIQNPTTEIVNLEYEDTFGVTVGFDFAGKNSIKFAHNSGEFTATQQNGAMITADDEINAVGYTYGTYANGFYLGFNANQAEFHEVDNLSRIIRESQGIELFTSYRGSSDWMPFLEFNQLEADSSYSVDYPGEEFTRQFTMIGVKYFWDPQTAIYFDVRIDSSDMSAAQEKFEDDGAGIGIRFNF